jgi:hypothetical protein
MNGPSEQKALTLNHSSFQKLKNRRPFHNLSKILESTSLRNKHISKIEGQGISTNLFVGIELDDFYLRSMLI